MPLMKRRELLLAGLASLGVCAWPLPAQAQLPLRGRPLQFGVLPITSTRVLLGNYAPVQAYLERALGQPVELVTGPDFRTFHHNTMQGHYDLVVTASHLGRFAQLDAGWVPLVRYTALHQTLLVTSRERPLRQIEELRGRSLAGPDALTLSSIEAQDWLQTRGLRLGIDYKYLETPTPPSAAHALINGQSVLAVSSPQGLKNTPEALRDQLSVFASLVELPNLLWLAHPRLATHQATLRSALLGLNTPAVNVAAFFEATGYQSVREVSVAELASADKYLPRLRSALRVRP
jgi:phosphonate transport system substrate-binding protein